MSEMKSLFVRLILVALMMGTFGTGATIQDRKEKIHDLIRQLGQGDWQKAVNDLVEIGNPAVEPLIRILKDRSIKTWTIQARSLPNSTN